MSPKTGTTCLEGVATLTAFLAERGMPTAVEAITREHLEEWLIAMRDAGRKPTTVAACYRSVRQSYRCAAADEGFVQPLPDRDDGAAEDPREGRAVRETENGHVGVSLRTSFRRCSA